jgi:hypothetical protein
VLTAEQHEYDDFDALQDDYHARGWTDGLPVVPPNPERVEKFLGVVGLEPAAVLGAVPTRDATVTAELVAINAVMAGCAPEYMPVVVAAVRAHLNEMANCHSTTGTLSGAAQVVVVNGPVRRPIGVHGGAGCFGPGWRANATIGRALRLVIRNACRAVPGVFDRASFSTPARYAFCFGEDEEASPWTPMHVERGFATEQSTVTVHSTMSMLAAGDYASREPEGLADTIVATLRRNGTAGDRWLGDETNVLLVVGEEHRRVFTDAGWSKADFRDYAWPRLQEPPGPNERPVKLGHPEGLLMVAAGGPGMPETWIMFPHLGRAITEPVVMTSGP